METPAASTLAPEGGAMAEFPAGLLNLQEFPTMRARSSRSYESLTFIGQGADGQVYRATERGTGEVVALKKIRTDEEEVIPPEARREIKILKMLNHENVIQLKEIALSPGHEKDEQGKPGDKYEGSVYMVFEYMNHDLVGLLKSGIQFTAPQIKCYMLQLLTAVHHCHVNQVIHRDIKGANILVNNEGYLKLADFGLACTIPGVDGGKLTNEVVTLWYRAPELLLGETEYGPAVDMWSVGCVFGELLNQKEIFLGKNEWDLMVYEYRNQFEKICETCGTPDELSWPGVSILPNYQSYKLPLPVKRQVRERFKHFDYHSLELLERMLTLNPAQRISAKDALDADYFRIDPLPCDRESLPKYEEELHEYEARRKRRRKYLREEMRKLEKELQLAGPANLAPALLHGGQEHPQVSPGVSHLLNASPQAYFAPQLDRGQGRGPNMMGGIDNQNQQHGQQ